MESMDKELTVPKWVLIVWSKIPQMPTIYLPNLFAQVQKFWISMKKASSGVRSRWSELRQRLSYQTLLLCRSAFLSGRLSVQKGTRYLGLKIQDLQYGQFRVLTFIRKW